MIYAPRSMASEYSDAQAQCAAYADGPVGDSWGPKSCDAVKQTTCLNDGIQQTVIAARYVYKPSGAKSCWAMFPYSGPKDPPGNPCSGMAGSSIYQDGKITSGSTTCVRGPQQADGSSAMCGATLTPISGATWNPYLQKWQTYLQFSPTGSVCGVGQGDNPGAVAGPDGGPNTTAPPIPDPVPASNPEPPKLCGGVSCYDPATGDACALSGGVQVCVNTGTGSNGNGSSGNSGGCATSGDVTLCTGSPHAPTPPPGAVPNPPGQTQGTDGGLHADPSTGSTFPTTTTIYGPPGSTPNNGSAPGDYSPTNPTGNPDGGDPAPPSSSASPPGTFSGGGGCDEPPACTGDAVACGAARTQWATTCQLHKDLTGDGTGQSEFDALKAKHTDADVWQEGSQSSGDTLTDNANAGIYDQSGFSFARQCPMTDLEVPFLGKTLSVKFSKGCVIGPWIHGVVVAMALFLAGLITLGKRS